MPEAPALPADDRCLAGLCAALTALPGEPIDRVLAGFVEALRLELAALLVCHDGVAVVRALGTRERRVAPEQELRLSPTWTAGMTEGRVIAGKASELSPGERAGLRLGPATSVLLAPLPALEGPPGSALLIAADLAEAAWSSAQEQALRGLAAGLAGWLAARERQRLLDALPLRIAWKDASLRHRAVNRAFARASGLVPAQLLGRSDDSNEAATKRERLALSTATLRRIESAPLPGEREQWFEVSRIPHEGGVLIVQDEISARVALGQQLQLALRIAAVGRLAGGLAAELRPITEAIAASVATAREEPARPAELERIELCARQVDDLLLQLAAFDRRQPREAIELVPGQLLTRMQPALVRLLGERVALEIVPPALRCVVRLDPRLCEHLFAALAVHLRGRLRSRGRVVVEATPETLADEQALALALPAGEYLRLRWRLEPASAPAGLDLRLALAHTIAGIAGGALHDDGATLNIYLPRVFAAPRPEAGTGPLVDIRGAETLLLVEDEPVLALTLATTLRHLGYRVRVAEDLSTALAHCTESPETVHAGVALALLSTSAPEPRELVRRLREAAPDLRVLWLGRGLAAAGLGGDPLIVPCTFEALALRVRQALDSRLS